MVRYRFTPDRHFPRPEAQGPDPGAVEHAFAKVVRALVDELAIGSLRLVGLETRSDCSVRYNDGQAVGSDQLGPLVGHLVREECWGSLESGGFSVRVGYDFHLVVAAPRWCPGAVAIARSVALFVEELRPEIPVGQDAEPDVVHYLTTF